MAEKRPQGRLPGNDGRWFLELVGAVEPDPDSTGTYATLEQLVPPPAPDDTSTIAATSVGTTANGALETDASRNGAPPGSAGVRSRAHTGWWVLAASIVLVALAIGAAVVLVPRAANAEAEAAAAAHLSALVGLRNELPATQAALAALTDPASGDDAVAEVPAALAGLNALTGRVLAVATAPLPSTLPLVSRRGFDALEPTRDAMVVLAGEASDLGSRLGAGYMYRTSISSLFAIGPLPVQLDDTAITDLSVELAGDLADTGRIVADLPLDPAFAAVRDLATAASERYATWQLEYLDALHEADAVRTEALIAELAAIGDQLDSALDDALLSMRSDLDAEIVRIAGELETAIDAASAPG
jgi:hypothetical protein